MSHILQTNTLQDDSALFALALGPATRTSIALCGGGQRGFADISLLYSVWSSLRLPVSLITPPSLERFLPTSVPQAVSGDISQKNQAATAWQLIDGAGMVVVGPNMQLASAEQVFYARLLPRITVPTVLTDESLSLWAIDVGVKNNSNITWVASTDRVEKIYQNEVGKINRARGIFGVAEFLRQLPTRSDFLVVYDAMHLYSYIPSTDTLIHSPLHGSQKLSRNLAISLLPVTVFARSRGVELEERLKVLHYLYSIIGEKSIGSPVSWSGMLKHLLS